jgi:hypothetical protein
LAAWHRRDAGGFTSITKVAVSGSDQTYYLAINLDGGNAKLETLDSTDTSYATGFTSGGVIAALTNATALDTLATSGDLGLSVGCSYNSTEYCHSVAEVDAADPQDVICLRDTDLVHAFHESTGWTSLVAMNVTDYGNPLTLSETGDATAEYGWLLAIEDPDAVSVNPALLKDSKHRNQWRWF